MSRLGGRLVKHGRKLEVVGSEKKEIGTRWTDGKRPNCRERSAQYLVMLTAVVLTHRNGNLRQNERIAADFEALEHFVFCPCRTERELRIDLDLSDTMERSEGKCG